MTLSEFHKLREENQLVYIWDNGQFLMKRLETIQVRVVLYDCGEFFAEVFYYTETNVILSHRAFANSRLLEPYLDEIQIGKVL
jgi:hypothetical protein